MNKTSSASTELAHLPATTALSLFRSRSLSPLELLDAVIACAECHERSLNAFTDRYYEEARLAASEAGERYAGSGEPPRALEGLAIALKEEAAVAGLPSRQGSLLYEANIARHTAPIARRVLDAGAIVHARTTTPELCAAGFTHSDLWGVTLNPWNPEFSSGGSSGGSAVALAAGFTTLATGSDIAGSIRIPASACGVVGYKPPYARVPQPSPWNLDHYCHDGPMARTVSDCALLENVIAGPTLEDFASLPAAADLPLDYPSDLAGLRIGVSVDLSCYEVEPEIITATLTAATLLQEAGALVEEVAFAWDRPLIMDTAFAHYGAVFGPSIAASLGGDPERAMRYALEIAQDAIATLERVGYMQSLEMEARICSALATVFERVDVLVCPTMATPAFAAGEDYIDKPLEINGVAMERYLEGAMTIPFNIASRCPVLSVPNGRASTGVPIGLQIVGRPHDEVSVFQVGAAFERMQQWLDVPERRPDLAG